MITISHFSPAGDNINGNFLVVTGTEIMANIHNLRLADMTGILEDDPLMTLETQPDEISVIGATIMAFIGSVEPIPVVMGIWRMLVELLDYHQPMEVFIGDQHFRINPEGIREPAAGHNGQDQDSED